MTQQQIRAQQLLDLEFTEINGKSSKYRIFIRPETRYIYVGKKGAIRYGNSISDSTPMNADRLITTLQRKFR